MKLTGAEYRIGHLPPLSLSRRQCVDAGQPNRSQGMSYIDGFVIAVPSANKQKFIEHARHFDPLFIELGAIRVIEGWGDDVPDGKVTDFRRAVQATTEENGGLCVG